MSSVAFDKIVQLGLIFVFDDIHFIFALKKYNMFFTYLTNTSVDRINYYKFHFGVFLEKLFPQLIDNVEYCSISSYREHKIEPILSWIQFGVERQTTSNPYIQFLLLLCSNETSFKLPVSCKVRVPSITENVFTNKDV